jgi:hypothetical protein
MTSFSETLYPRTGEVARQWQTATSRTDQRWSIRYSSIPAIVGAFDVFFIITAAVLTNTLYSSLQETNADLTRYAATAIIVAAIFVPILHNRSL